MILSDTGRRSTRNASSPSKWHDAKSPAAPKCYVWQDARFIKDLAEHQFFASCSFTNARYTFDQLAAQMSLIELVGEPTNVKNARRNQHELPIDQCESRDCAVPRKDRLMRSFNLLPDARPFSLPRRRSGKNALKGFRRRGAIA